MKSIKGRNEFGGAGELADYILPLLDEVGSRKIRTKTQRERYGLAGYFLCQLAQGRLRFPVSIVHRDCPDWAIECGDQRIGLEITEHKSDNFGTFLRLLEESDGLGECEELIFPKDQQKLSVEQLREMTNRRTLRGMPIMGDRMEVAWGKRVAFTSAWKARKIAKYKDVDSFSDIDLCVVDIRPETVSYGSLQPKHRRPVFEEQLAYPLRRIVCVDSAACEFDLCSENWWFGRINEGSATEV